VIRRQIRIDGLGAHALTPVQERLSAKDAKDAKDFLKKFFTLSFACFAFFAD
jgi:hypothetical protein